jgi:hypothetical protein
MINEIDSAIFDQSGVLLKCWIHVPIVQYIGTLDVPRPTSKIEIVAAMRRIRVSSMLVVITSLMAQNKSE